MSARIQLVTREYNDCHAGAKAPRDAAVIAERLGFRRLCVRRQMPPVAALSGLYLIRWAVKSLWYFMRIPRGSLIFLQFTSLAFTGRMSVRMLGLMRKLRQTHIITLVHDADVLRGWVRADRPDGTDLRLRQIVSISDSLIVHNAAMENWFEERGVPSARLVELGLFDYLSDAPAVGRTLSNEIVIAGNLSRKKAAYLSSLASVTGVRWNLYGPEYDGTAVRGGNVVYRGCHSPEELPRFLTGSFGLVWDGDSIATCGGMFGGYLRYNNPHKLSLYLAACLPVIVWNQSAVAELVRSGGLGICVGSLAEIPAALSALDSAAYDRMCRNARCVSEKLRAGRYLESAVGEAIGRLEKRTGAAAAEESLP